MKFYRENTVRLVRDKRQKEGIGVKKLENIFNIPSSTISRWIRDLPGNSKAFNAARAKEQTAKNQYKKDAEALKITSQNARFLCAMLYWCEGSKYPSTNFVAFANSDENLIYTFLFLLRKGFKINEKKLRIHLQLHTTHDQRRMIKYWSNLLKIPQNQFQKTTITKPTTKRKRRGYSGTCTIKYFDVNLLLGIIGLYESFQKKKD